LFISKFDKIVLWMITTHATSQNWKEKRYDSMNLNLNTHPQIWNHVAIEIIEAANREAELGGGNWSLWFHFRIWKNLELKFSILIWEWTQLVLNVKLAFLLFAWCFLIMSLPLHSLSLLSFHLPFTLFKSFIY
jgi:hypothetical protein